MDKLNSIFKDVLRWLSPQMILHNRTTVKQLHRLALYQPHEEMIHSWMVEVPGILFQASHEKTPECFFSITFVLLYF